MEEKREKRLDTDAILASIGDAVVEIDRDRNINIWNRAAEAITGFRAAHVIGKPYYDALRFLSEEGGPPRYDFIEEAFGKGIGVDVPKRVVAGTAYERPVPIEGIAAPVRDEKGSILGVVVAFRDVTKERELDRIRFEFLSLASHQLRTPLSGTKWLIETLMAQKIGSLTKEQKEYLAYVYQSNERMIKLVNDLLSLARLESGSPTVTVSSFTVGALVQECYLFSKNVADEAGISFVYDVSDPSARLLGDRILLKTILDVFVSNALTYSKPGGAVSLRAAGEGEFIHFSVRDEGIGIPKEERPRIFHKFYRATNAKAMKADGTGLGLYIAKFLADILGAVIRVESIENKGSTFHLTVPLRQTSFPEHVTVTYAEKSAA